MEEPPVCRIQDFFQIVSLYKGFQIHTVSGYISGKEPVQIFQSCMLLNDPSPLLYPEPQSVADFPICLILLFAQIPFFLCLRKDKLCLLHFLLGFIKIRHFTSLDGFFSGLF